MSEKPSSDTSDKLPKNRVDSWVNKAKNHKVLSVLIFAAIVIGGLASVSESVRKIIKPLVEVTERRADSKLTRLDVEAILQANRGNIERCLSALAKQYFYLDFVFTQGPGSTIDVDVLLGQVVHSEVEFLHPALRKKEVERFGGHDALIARSRSGDRKLSVVAPTTNGCIIQTLSKELNSFQIDHWEQGFIHRYITDQV